MESSRSIGDDSTKKGKAAEFLVFSELLRRDADLYLPIIDIGVDAIIRQKGGTYLEVQAKSTEKEDQAGYFNIDLSELQQRPEDKFFIICIDMNQKNYIEQGKPNIWVIPAKDYKKYMTASGRLPIYERRHGDKEPRYKLLQNRFYAWGLLTG